MKHLRLETRITIWSVLVVTVGIVVCGTVSTLYVQRKERIELDQQLAAEAKHFFEEWRRHGARLFDWVNHGKQANDWIPASSPPRKLEVIDGRNHLVYRSRSLPSDFLEGLAPGYSIVSAGDTNWRVGVFREDGLTLRLAGDLEGVNDLAEELATAFLITLPIVLAFVFLGGRLIAHKALAPIQEIATFAEQITAQGLGQRIPLPRARDEIHRLGMVLNATFDRLEQSFRQATRFSADASHELKTPLTVLRTSIESMLRSPSLDLAAQQNLAGLLEETKRLSAITESLLLLSRADAGKLQLDLQPGDLAEVVGLCADDAAIFFEPGQIELERHLPASAPALIDRTRLSQILLNLLDNARKYNRARGRVRIVLTGENGAWQVRVANTGSGIARDDIPQLFTRFFRGEHSSEKAGHGLGLSLSRELARAHHGDLLLTESDPGWTTFVLVVPKLPSDFPVADGISSLTSRGARGRVP